MNLNVSSSDGFVVVKVDGRIDTTNAAEFEQKMTGLTQGGSAKVILDCTGLNYISSSGLRVFLVIQKSMLAGGGQFRLCCLQPGIREIFDISGFSVIFSVYSDLAAAVNG
jgi:anti-anti-sigma factor